MNLPTGANAAPTHLPTLDGWRAVAIALVLLAHGSDSLLAAIGAEPGLAPGLKHLGMLGVQLFFGLSGFLITSRLLDEEQRHGSVSLQSFYLRRTFRILPAAFAYLLVVGLLALAGTLSVSPGRWLSTLLFWANYSWAEHSWYLGHFWSLAVEEHFYFVWPLVFVLAQRPQRRLRLALAGAALLALWRAVDFKFQLSGSAPTVFWGRSDIQADSILWGVALALLYADAAWRARLQAFFDWPAGWPALALCLLALQCLPELNWKAAFVLMSFKSALIPLLLLGTVLHAARWPGRLLQTPALRWLGRLSYSLYLWQQLFLVWSEDRVPGLAWLQSAPVNFLAVFACAWLSLRYIETPLIARGACRASAVSATGVNSDAAQGAPTKLWWAPSEEAQRRDAPNSPPSR